MKRIRASLVAILLVTPLLFATSARATTYDGHCYTNVNQDSGDASIVQPYSEYLCSGTFIGAMKVELWIEYYPKSDSKVTLAPQGYLVQNYNGANVPTFDYVITVAPRYPDYYSRAVLRVSWETDQLGCDAYGCYRIWNWDTLASPWD